MSSSSLKASTSVSTNARSTSELTNSSRNAGGRIYEKTAAVSAVGAIVVALLALKWVD